MSDLVALQSPMEIEYFCSHCRISFTRHRFLTEWEANYATLGEVCDICPSVVMPTDVYDCTQCLRLGVGSQSFSETIFCKEHRNGV